MLTQIGKLGKAWEAGAGAFQSRKPNRQKMNPSISFSGPTGR